MKKILILTFIIATQIFAQNNLSQNLNEDMSISFFETFQKVDSTNLKIEKKSVGIAAGLSALIPGAGQFYNEDYWTSAIFIGIEVAAIATAIIYTNKGNTQTEIFEDFANENWSAVTYAEWTLAHAAELNENLDITQFNVFDEQHNLNWSELNRLESAIGSYYSHQLAPFGDQQYYEMIGKYTQFNVGWSDFDGGDYHYGEPVTPLFTYYSGERGKANNFYNIARWGSIVIVTNHIFSMAEAAFTTNRRNKSLDLNVQLKRQTFYHITDYYPELSVRIRI